MPIDPDYAREERIKRLRTLVKSGMDKMLILHDGVPEYLRLGDTKLQSQLPEFFHSDRMLEDLPDDVRRNIDIGMGVNIAERLHGTYSKIYKWVAGADNGSARNLDEQLYVRYRMLASLHKSRIDTSIATPVEDQIQTLAGAIESRVQIFGEQLRVDGEHEDVSSALRDAPGGWFAQGA